MKPLTNGEKYRKIKPMTAAKPVVNRLAQAPMAIATGTDMLASSAGGQPEVEGGSIVEFLTGQGGQGPQGLQGRHGLTSGHSLASGQEPHCPVQLVTGQS